MRVNNRSKLGFVMAALACTAGAAAPNATPDAAPAIPGLTVVTAVAHQNGAEKIQPGAVPETRRGCKDALAKRYGIDAGRLGAAGFGKSQPKDTNETLEGRAHNRRVELAKIS